MTGRKRGPYKRYLEDAAIHIPKQTLSNWLHRGTALNKPSQTPPPQSSDDELANETPTSPSVPSSPVELASSPSSSLAPTPTSPQQSTVDELASPGPSESVPLQPLENLLYPGVQISETTGRLLIQSLALKHGLTKLALTDILQLVQLHLPLGCKPDSYKSLYCFNKESTASSAVEHKLCNDCCELIDDVSADNGCPHSKIVKFYELPLDAQLQALFMGKVLFTS